MFWKRHRAKRGFKAYVRRSARVLRWTLRLCLLFLILDLVYLGLTWPDWNKIANGPIPKSAFMREYENQLAQNKNWPRLRWQPVAFSVFPRHLLRAVILAEDSRFYEHSGFDLIAFKEAMDHNLKEGRFVFGASTISQQTVKNLFLTPSRNPLRKWHELILTWGMERQLSKRRILDIYLNVAQFGQGIYGVQAASQVYWGINPDSLSPAQAAELVATLPSPVKSNPATRTRYFDRRSKKLLVLLERYPGDAAEAVRERPFDLFLPPPENENELLPDNGSELSPDVPPVPSDKEPSPTERRSAYPPVEDRSIRSNPI
ncbi:MAG: monofunctional biosynthetic peptidoglycan transglycosylase [Sulfuricaulis sp.]|uniref:monofunctional biosynthetic peptidoglycan transglycosylase n=1 Tax=Sulfuricaulis sp. TaxID=2003553 RepID=UPI0025CD1981|nr:monofunctional biosynthetic peptidoglycan transglycosylase [Sulfuricaulis sp.]MCR4346061.1 monofunctional biosynthetic peptidoglycan transglycosylase [Sulfuricaulis sp.]